MITLTGPLKIWSNDEGSSHFMSVPAELSDDIRAAALAGPRGFGSVRVEATIDGPSTGSGQAVTWRTSLFPSKSSGGYFLPVKIDVCRRAGRSAGADVTGNHTQVVGGG